MSAPQRPRAPGSQGPGDRSAVEVAIVYCRSASVRSEERRTVVGEGPLTIQIEDGDSYTVMRTPGDDAALALGFLFAEGMIDSAEAVKAMWGCGEGNIVRVKLRDTPRDRVRRNLLINASCGLCGREAIEKMVQSLPAVEAKICVTAELLFRLPQLFRQQQRLFERTGGSHAAALFSPEGELPLLGEDLGRHSALDKVLGRALKQRLQLDRYGVMLSGRTSLEMVVKAARARIGLVVSVSAASQASLVAAERLGITLCGFARGNELAIYTHPSRIQ